ALAVLVRAEEGAALLDSLLRAGLGRIKAVGRTLRVTRDTALLREHAVVVRAIPVGDPLPDVARHVEEAVAVGREGSDRSGGGEPILTGVFFRKVSLEGGRRALAAGLEFVAPRIGL